MIVQFHVERLVLEGLVASPAEAFRVADAVTQELRRLLETGQLGELRSGGAWVGRTAPDVSVGARDPSPDVGRRIAQSVHASLAGVADIGGSARPMRRDQEPP
jgi:hypothetical protein